MKSFYLSAVAVASAFAAGSAVAEPVAFDYWYGLTGDLGEVVQETCTRFNAAQADYVITCVGQDGYETAVQNTIAAFRAGQHPTVLQSFDAGTADLMLSGQFYPVYQMMADFGIDIDWANYIPAIANYYSTSDGKFVSMPFNSSTPVYYFNTDHLAAAGITEAPLTFEGLEVAMNALKAAGYECPMAYAPSVWIDLEQFSMSHNIPVASNDNGYSGIDTQMLYNTTLEVQHIENIKRWLDEGLYVMRTADSGLSARDSFVQGECSMFFSSIADHNTVSKTAPAELLWDVQMIPTYEGYERHNTVVGGASLWVLAGKTEAEYRGAAAYLQFLATPESEEWFVSNTGYIPVTIGAYDALVAKGFYDNAPYAGRETAIDSLTFTPPNNLTRGLRIGSMIQTRAEWTNEVTAALNGDKPVQEALDTAVARSNEIMARFAQTYAGKSFP